MIPDADAIVIGSGCSGVHAAWALCAAPVGRSGTRRVLMLDAGARDTHYAGLIPPRPWQSLRQAEHDQHRYFLGDAFEGVPAGEVRVGAQLTPPRAHVGQALAECAPVAATNLRAFAGLCSLAEGGLGSAWGAGVARFTDADLEGTGLRASDLEPHYRAVEEHIGICGAHDDLSPHLGLHAGLMPPLALDTGSKAVLRRYLRRRAGVLGDGLALGVTRLAACSTGFTTPGGHTRGPHRLDDLDFYSDSTRAVYRPAWTLAELRERANFTYRGGVLARRFIERRESTGGPLVEVEYVDLATGAVQRVTARRLVLAAGVLGTARLVLASRGRVGDALPLVCNPYTYAPALNLNVVGEAWTDRRHSLSQLTGVYFPPARGAVARSSAGWGAGEREPDPLHVSLYSYRSLLSFKLMKEMPLPMPAARRVARVLQAVVCVLGIHHPAHADPGRRVVLERAASTDEPGFGGGGAGGGAGRLRIEFALTAREAHDLERREQALVRVLRRLRLWVLSRTRPGPGASIHYAGALPMRPDPGAGARAWTCDPRGVLHGTRAVHVADGCLLPRLPAKGLTLTLMAMAHRVGTLAARELAHDLAREEGA